MKEEIEKILKEAVESDENGWFNSTEVAIQLEKFFLSKQIELLEGIITGNVWVATCNKLRDTITKLKSELKELQ